MTTLIIYGITTCGSVKKALAWAKQANCHVDFRDLKTYALDANTLQGWLNHGTELKKLVNKSSTTWRTFSLTAREALLTNPEALTAQLLRTPLLIKRPVIEWPTGCVTVGVDEALWASHYAQLHEPSSP